MGKTTYTTTKFDIGLGFYVEVSPNQEYEGLIDFVLCRKQCGIKFHMFGVHEKDCPEETWEEAFEDCIDDYIVKFIKDVEYLNNQPLE